MNINKHKHSISSVFVFRDRSFNPFWKFLRLRNSAWDFLGVNFWTRDFLGFDFCPRFDHPRHLKFGVLPWAKHYLHSNLSLWSLLLLNRGTYSNKGSFIICFELLLHLHGKTSTLLGCMIITCLLTL